MMVFEVYGSGKSDEAHPLAPCIGTMETYSIAYTEYYTDRIYGYLGRVLYIEYIR
jgi:hypothetical protein